MKYAAHILLLVIVVVAVSSKPSNGPKYMTPVRARSHKFKPYSYGFRQQKRHHNTPRRRSVFQEITKLEKNYFDGFSNLRKQLLVTTAQVESRGNRVKALRTELQRLKTKTGYSLPRSAIEELQREVGRNNQLYLAAVATQKKLVQQELEAYRAFFTRLQKVVQMEITKNTKTTNRLRLNNASIARVLKELNTSKAVPKSEIGRLARYSTRYSWVMKKIDVTGKKLKAKLDKGKKKLDLLQKIASLQKPLTMKQIFEHKKSEANTRIATINQRMKAISTKIQRTQSSIRRLSRARASRRVIEKMIHLRSKLEKTRAKLGKKKAKIIHLLSAQMNKIRRYYGPARKTSIKRSKNPHKKHTKRGRNKKQQATTKPTGRTSAPANVNAKAELAKKIKDVTKRSANATGAEKQELAKERIALLKQYHEMK